MLLLIIAIHKFTNKMGKFNLEASFFFLGLFRYHSGKPVSNAKIYLETEPGRKTVAFQQTGEAGRVTFAHLNKGVYKIVLEIPFQSGKRTEKEEKGEGDLQVGYHSKKQLYFFQQPQGYFTVKFSDLKHLNHSNITPMFELEKTINVERVVIGKLEVTSNCGRLSMFLSAHTQRKYLKQVQKYKEDSEMAVIRNS